MLSDLKKTNFRISAPRRKFANLEQISTGRVVETDWGEFYLCERSLSEFHQEPERVVSEYVALFNEDLLADTHEDFYSLLASEPGKVLFLDIETTGLSNCPLFLIGTMYLDDSNDRADRSTFKLDLLFARDYSEESTLLHYLNNLFAKFDVLVSFNGKSFDIPFIKNRMDFYRMPQDEFNLFHFDVLIHSRRKWGGITANCQLQTLETDICGRRRIGDIPGALIPEVYHEFVRTGNPQLLKEVFHHNALDLITMAELIVALLDD